MTLLLLATLAQAQDAPDIGVDDDLMSFLQEQQTKWPDRSGPPEVKPAEVWELPTWEEHQLSPGVKILHVPVEGVRKVHLSMFRQKGSLMLDGGESVASYATGWLADTATAHHDASELEMALDLLDAGLSFSGVSLVRHHASIDAPVEDFPAALDLFTEVLREPIYPKKDLKRWTKEELLDLLVLGPTQPAMVAGAAADYAWFPVDAPYGKRPDLTEYKLDGASLALRNDRLNHEAPFLVVVAGDIDWATLEPLLKKSFDGIGAEAEPDMYPPFEPREGDRFVAVHLPGAEQAVVRMRMDAPERGHADAPAIEQVTWAYGGAFLSRLNRSLREEHGWTYGSYAVYQQNPSFGHLTVYYDTATDTASDSIAETARILDKLVEEGPNDDELDAAWREEVGMWNDTLVDGVTAGETYAVLARDGRTVEGARERLVAKGELTPEVCQEAAARWFSPKEGRLWIVVGDRDTLAPELEELGWTWEWTTAEDVVLGRID